MSSWFTSLRKKSAAASADDPAESPEFPADFDDETIDIIRRVRPFTMTSPERVHAVVSAVAHVVRHQIVGDIVECGVWRGGSSMAAALALLNRKATDRDLYLFDTFEGMTPPTENDVTHDGAAAKTLLEREKPEDGRSVWCVADEADVRSNLGATEYPAGRLHFVRGSVEETVPDGAPEKIAILRLDTDWYESTKHELEHLYPRLVPGGVLIIDDYGHWDGARRATDEYLAAHDIPLFLHRIDYTGRMAIKPA